MLPSPLPLWLRLLVVQAVADYAKTAKLCEQRCADIAAAGHRGQGGRLCDGTGSIDEYRMDAKYCAGVATRLPALLEESLTASERDKILHEIAALENGDSQHSREIPKDPKELARWAWENPWKEAVPVPLPEYAVKDYRADELMQPLTQRQAEAVILCRVCKMETAKVAPIMGITINAVERLVREGMRDLRSREHLYK